MLKTSFAAIILFCVFTGSQAQSPEQQIRQVLGRQLTAWNNGDLDAFMQTYWNNDSLVFVGKKGVVYGYRQTLENYKKSYFNREQMGTLAFDIIQVKRLSTEYYQVTGKYMLTRKVGDAAGYFTLLVHQINGQWLIISDHSS